MTAAETVKVNHLVSLFLFPLRMSLERQQDLSILLSLFSHVGVDLGKVILTEHFSYISYNILCMWLYLHTFSPKYLDHSEPYIYIYSKKNHWWTNNLKQNDKRKVAIIDFFSEVWQKCYNISFKHLTVGTGYVPGIFAVSWVASLLASFWSTSLAYVHDMGTLKN